MSNLPDAPGRSWRTSALTVLGYAAVVVTALALVGPFVAETITKIAFLLLGAASWLRSHSDPQFDAGENEDTLDDSPGSTPIQAQPLPSPDPLPPPEVVAAINEQLRPTPMDWLIPAGVCLFALAVRYFR